MNLLNEYKFDFVLRITSEIEPPPNKLFLIWTVYFRSAKNDDEPFTSENIRFESVRCYPTIMRRHLAKSTCVPDEGGSSAIFAPFRASPNIPTNRVTGKIIFKLDQPS